MFLHLNECTFFNQYSKAYSWAIRLVWRGKGKLSSNCCEKTGSRSRTIKETLNPNVSEPHVDRGIEAFFFPTSSAKSLSFQSPDKISSWKILRVNCQATRRLWASHPAKLSPSQLPLSHSVVSGYQIWLECRGIRPQPGGQWSIPRCLHRRRRRISLILQAIIESYGWDSRVAFWKKNVNVATVSLNQLWFTDFIIRLCCLTNVYHHCGAIVPSPLQQCRHLCWGWGKRDGWWISENSKKSVVLVRQVFQV